MKKYKSKVIKSSINNKDILETFQEILGTSENNVCLHIAHPKYVKLQTHINRFLKILMMFRDSTVMSKFLDIKSSLNQYIESLEKDYHSSFNAPNLDQYFVYSQSTLAGNNYSTLPPEIKKEFSNVYTKIKNCNIINIIIVTCKNLLSYKKFIEDKEKLSDLFLTKSSGNLIAPLPEFNELNFKKIYNDDALDTNDKNFILIFLSKLYEISYNVYESLSEPDVDVNEFVIIILNSIDTVKKHIPRCNEAFDKIVESVDLLKVNFGDYYKDFIASNNPAIIMEHFVLDVAKNTKPSPTLTAQFRRIITHYRNIASKSTNTDPRLQNLFKHVDENFEELEKYKKDNDSYSEEPVTEESTTEELVTEELTEEQVSSSKEISNEDKVSENKEDNINNNSTKDNIQ